MKYAELNALQNSSDAHTLLEALETFELCELRDNLTARVNHTIQVELYVMISESETIFVIREDSNCPDVEYNEDTFNATPETLNRIAIYDNKRDAIADFNAVIRDAYWDL